MTTSRKVLIASVICLVVLAISSFFIFTDFGRALINFGKTKGVLIDRETGKASAYSVKILKMEDIEKDAVKGWLDRCIESYGLREEQAYYTLYNNAAEGMDMYLFMPEAKGGAGNISRSDIKVSKKGTSLMIYIDKEEETGYNKENTDLILHVYSNKKSGETKAKTERLIIDGKAYSSTSSTFMVLE